MIVNNKIGITLSGGGFRGIAHLGVLQCMEELGISFDAISGASAGARRQVLDSYIQRLKDLEDIAFGFGGVKNAYAIQAGRELRVIVESEKVSDEAASNLSFDISQKIQTEMTYPGQVKITVIRETRAVNIAK